MRTSLLCSIVFLGAVARTATPQSLPGELPPIRIILVGDSTMAVKTGYGPGFCAAVLPQASCVNMAKGGRSTKSYREEGSWDEVRSALRNMDGYRATYVLIQFGHNDQPNKPGRSTDVKTEFPANLRRYVHEVREAGAIPVLVTPLTRRMFRDGKLADTLGAWAEATRTVAEQESAPLLDLYRESSTAVGQAGPVQANTFAMAHPAPAYADAAKTGTSLPLPPKQTSTSGPEPHGDPGPVFDYTHLGSKGASYFGRMVAGELANTIPDIKPYIKQQ